MISASAKVSAEPPPSHEQIDRGNADQAKGSSTTEDVESTFEVLIRILVVLRFRHPV